MKTRRKQGLSSDQLGTRAFFARGFVFCLSVLAVACVETRLSSQGAALPEAAGAPLPKASPALAPDFDPLEPEATAMPEAAPEHDHSAHSGTRTIESNPETTESNAEATEPSAGSASTLEQPAPQSFTCPMHPEIVRPEPGKCPICGMKLVPVKPKVEPEVEP